MTLAHYYARIHFSAKFYMHNVLHRPIVYFDLISIHKSTNSFNCRLVLLLST